MPGTKKGDALANAPTRHRCCSVSDTTKDREAMAYCIATNPKSTYVQYRWADKIAFRQVEDSQHQSLENAIGSDGSVAKK